MLTIQIHFAGLASQGYRKGFVHLTTVSHPGPLTLVDGTLSGDDLTLAARLTARYSQGRDAAQVEVEATGPDGKTERLRVAPLAADEIPSEWLL